MSDKLFMVSLGFGWIMMGGLVLLLCIPCYVTLGIMCTGTIGTAITGLWANLISKDKSNGYGKYNE